MNINSGKQEIEDELSNLTVFNKVDYRKLETRHLNIYHN